MNFTPHEELQIRRAVLRLPARPTLDVEEFGFKRLGRKFKCVKKTKKKHYLCFVLFILSHRCSYIQE